MSDSKKYFKCGFCRKVFSSLERFGFSNPWTECIYCGFQSTNISKKEYKQEVQYQDSDQQI